MAKKKPELKEVFTPIDIGPMHLKNRFVRMGALSGIPKDDMGPGDIVSQRWLDHYESMARGGFGLVSVAGPAMISMNNEGTEAFCGILDFFPLEGYKAITDAIHKYGAKAIMQTLYGSPRPAAIDPDGSSWSSTRHTPEDMESLIPFFLETLEMSPEQIHIVVAKFADVAKIMQDAGFDGIEINSGHNHGLNAFLSPAWNKRTDEYGGTPENRARIVCEIIKAIKEKCGPDFAVINNFNGCEYNLEGGIRPADAIEHAKCFEAAGSDGLHVRFEFYWDAVPELDLVRASHEIPDLDLYPGNMDKDLTEFGIENRFGNGIAGWSAAAAQIKEHVNIPVCVAGRMDAFVGETLIEEGKLDLVNICRRAMADNDYVNKCQAGDFDDIRPCIGCFTCYDMGDRGVDMWCMANPTLFKPKDYATITPAETKKKVLVVGSGAAGLESARVLAMRGHEVILCEKDAAIGGSLPLAAFIKDFHEDFMGFSQWQQRQVKKLGVDIRTKTTVDRAYVEKLAPDAIIVAVGGSETIPDLPGIDKKIVVTGAKLHESLRKATKFFDLATLGKLSKVALPGVGKRVIILGGAIHGVQTATFLIKRGYQVTIVEESNEFGAGMLDDGPKPNLLSWLFENAEGMYRNLKYKEITDKGLVIEKDGEEKLLEADTIITTLPMGNNLDLYNEVKDLAPEVHAIGDCNPWLRDDPVPVLMLQPVTSKLSWPKFTATAVREAYRICREI